MQSDDCPEDELEYGAQLEETRIAKVINSHGKYICNACGLIFDKYNSCWDHTNQHVGNTTCKTCGKTFARKFGLKRHIQIVHNNHSGDKS